MPQQGGTWRPDPGSGDQWPSGLAHDSGGNAKSATSDVNVGAGDVVPAVPDPVRVDIEYKSHYSRGLSILGCLLLYGRVIAAIPILIVLYILGIVTFIVAWIMQFAVLFTGHYPEGAHEFVTGFIRWQTRTQAFILGVSDKYPTSMRP